MRLKVKTNIEIMQNLKYTLFFIAAISAGMTFRTFAQEDVVEKFEQAMETVKETMNKPLSVREVSVDSTVIEQGEERLDSNFSYHTNIDYYKLEESLSDDLRREFMDNEFTLKVVAIGVIVPCAAIALIVIGTFIYLIIKTRARNRIIEKAIENNYQLPDSFFNKHTRGWTDNPAEETASKTSTFDSQPELPPLPNMTKPPMSPYEKRQFSNAVVLVLLGLILFIALGSVFGLILGGIPFVIGASRLITFFYFNQWK